MRRLLICALKLYSEVGFHGTTTREIAKRANMSPAAVYVHFKSKEEILFSIALAMSKAGIAVIHEAARRPGRPSERLYRMASVHGEFHAKMCASARVTNFELRALEPSHYRIVIGIMNSWRQLYRDCFREGMESGEFVQRDLSIVTTALASLIVGVCRWFDPSGVWTPAEIGKQTGQMALEIAYAREVAGSDSFMGSTLPAP